jgi:hypothetical protein
VQGLYFRIHRRPCSVFAVGHHKHCVRAAKRDKGFDAVNLCCPERRRTRPRSVQCACERTVFSHCLFHSGPQHAHGNMVTTVHFATRAHAAALMARCGGQRVVGARDSVMG